MNTKLFNFITKAFAVMLICVLMLTTAVTVDAKAKKSKAAKKKLLARCRKHKPWI